MRYLAATFLMSTVLAAGPASAASAPLPDPEAELEVDFTAWAQANGVPFDRFACDVTAGEGNVCFVLAGPIVTAYIPSADGTGWDEYGQPPTPPATTAAAAVQPLIAQSNEYYSNCSEARDAGDTPLYEGDPGYRPGLDRDGDGVACE